MTVIGKKRRLGLIKRYGRTCHLCGERIAGLVTADHVVPRSLGGTNAYDNLRPAHFGCNLRRGNKPVEEARTAWQFD